MTRRRAARAAAPPDEGAILERGEVTDPAAYAAALAAGTLVELAPDDPAALPDPDGPTPLIDPPIGGILPETGDETPLDPPAEDAAAASGYAWAGEATPLLRVVRYPFAGAIPYQPGQVIDCARWPELNRIALERMGYLVAVETGEGVAEAAAAIAAAWSGEAGGEPDGAA